MTMSKAALDRCRRMRVTMNADGSGTIDIWDPQLKKTVNTYRARTATDVERVKRAYMKTYRVPAQLIEVVPWGKIPEESSVDEDTLEEAKANEEAPDAD